MAPIGKKQLEQLMKRYYTDSAVGGRLGVSRQAIYKLRKKYGIPAGARHVELEKRNRRIRELAGNGISSMVLAMDYGLSLPQIYRILQKEAPVAKSIKPQIFRSSQELRKILEKKQRSGKTVVTTNGCFDLLHGGHVQYLTEAAALGDILLVGLNSDASVQRLKGSTRPLQNEDDRALIMASLKMVDYVLIFEEDDPILFLDILKPNIHVKGGDYHVESLPETVVVRKNGGEIHILSFKEGVSTTGIVERILGEK